MGDGWRQLTKRFRSETPIVMLERAAYDLVKAGYRAEDLTIQVTPAGTSAIFTRAQPQRKYTPPPSVAVPIIQTRKQKIEELKTRRTTGIPCKHCNTLHLATSGRIRHMAGLCPACNAKYRGALADQLNHDIARGKNLRAGAVITKNGGN